MIIIKNKTTKINIVGSENETLNDAKYSDLIKLCIDHPPMGANGNPVGFTIEDIRKRLRVVDSLKENNGEIKLEDADYELVVQSVTEFKWMAVNQSIVDFVDDIQKGNK